MQKSEPILITSEEQLQKNIDNRISIRGVALRTKDEAYLRSFRDFVMEQNWYWPQEAENKNVEVDAILAWQEPYTVESDPPPFAATSSWKGQEVPGTYALEDPTWRFSE